MGLGGDGTSRAARLLLAVGEGREVHMSRNVLPSQLRLRGTVSSLNFSAMGYIEGAIVETERGREQVNFASHRLSTISHEVVVGSTIDLDAEVEAKSGDHAVYRLCEREGEATGEIVRLNYALHGSINGYHLDDATFLHVKASGARKYKLHVGERVKATGVQHQGPDAVVMEVRLLERIERIGRRHDENGASV